MTNSYTPVQPAINLPSLGSLQSSVYNVQLLEYMMVCYRTPPSYCLPIPPNAPNNSFVEPDSSEEKKLIDNCLYSLGNAYKHMLVMLMDDLATEREKLLVFSHSSIVHLHKWLPPIKFENAVRIERPQMLYFDWPYLFAACDGYYTYNDKYCVFFDKANKEKFQEYMSMGELRRKELYEELIESRRKK